MQSPPLKDKPEPPRVVLPTPRNKGRAALFVLVPAVVGGVLGGVLGMAAQWMSGAELFWLFVVGFFIAGALLGVRTLFMVLSYGAKQAHEEHDSAHGE